MDTNLSFPSSTEYSTVTSTTMVTNAASQTPWTSKMDQAQPDHKMTLFQSPIFGEYVES